jgi:hypothetical protein
MNTAAGSRQVEEPLTAIGAASGLAVVDAPPDGSIGFRMQDGCSPRPQPGSGREHQQRSEHREV